MSTTSRPLRALVLLGLWAALLPATGCYFLDSEPVPEVSNYDLDLGELRSLANSIPGPKPVELRRELVGVGAMPRAFMMAGASWDEQRMTHVVFQALRADGRFVLLDSAQDERAHRMLPGAGPFHEKAWQAVLRGLSEAERIVISHEHADHIGGVAAHPDPQSLVGRLALNEAQLANEEMLDMADFPPSLREALEPLVFDDAIAIAPGIVVKKAPGHTPGNQIVFVQLESGEEILFVGDVVWNRDAITELRYRPRFITDWIIGEERTPAIHQLRALRDLYDSDEPVQIVIAHDARTHAHPRIRDGFVFRTAQAAP